MREFQTRNATCTIWMALPKAALLAMELLPREPGMSLEKGVELEGLQAAQPEPVVGSFDW